MPQGTASSNLAPSALRKINYREKASRAKALGGSNPPVSVKIKIWHRIDAKFLFYER